MHRPGAKLFCMGVVLLAAQANAGDWTVTNSLQISSFVSDNLSHRQDGDTGIGFTVRPLVGINGSGRRVSGRLTYAPSWMSYSGEDTPSDSLSHQLSAASSTELVRQTLFLGATATAALVNTSGFAAADSPDSAVGDESRQTYTLSVSPHSRHRFGSYANLAVRFGLNTVQAESGANGLNSTGNTFSVVLSSGAHFTRLPWSVQGSRSETSYRDDSQTSQSLQGTLGYRIDRKWRVDGTVGFEDQNVATVRNSTTGIRYSGTVRWTPNPRANAQVELGKRYFGTFWRASAQHRSRRSLFTLSLARDITNTRSLLLRQITEEELDAATEQLGLDEAQREFLRLLPVGELLDEDFLDTRMSAGLQLSGRRTSVNLRGDWSRREYEVTPRSDQTLGLSVSASRQLAPGFGGSAGVDWQSVDTTSGSDSQYWSLSLGASHTLGRYSRIGLTLTRQQRDTDIGTGDYAENRVSINFNTRMF